MGTMKTNKLEKSCGAIIFENKSKDSKVLIIQQVQGHWCFPKGHVEANETEQQTALREIKEETGLLVTLDTSKRYHLQYSPKKNVDKDTVYFVGYLKGGKEKIQKEELLDMRWVKPIEAMGCITHESCAAMLKRVMEDRKLSW